MKNILLEQFSPLCEIQAFVEEDESGVYFYLWDFPGQEYANIRSCWVRNYGPAPESLDFSAMEDGHAPMLPRDCCAHPSGAEKLDPDKLSIIWFAEGDAAALLYEDEVLAVIPGWAGQGPDGASYPAYARDCIAESPLCFPLGTPDTNALFARIESARQFWASWDEHPWPELQHQYLDAITSALGPVKNYYGIDGGHWPPKALVTIEKGEVTYAVTLGVSIVPQPKVEQYTESPERLRRFELAFACETKWLAENEQQLLSYISGQTSLPWSYLTFLAQGHTIPCQEISQIDSRFTAMLLAQPEHAPAIPFADVYGDPVNLLWMIPLTQQERQFAEANGTEALIRLAAGTTDEWIFNRNEKWINSSEN
ncbi:suppressor of fused domain protein [Brevibacillus agri]|uniref:suppressor of fused domain protein n=1 Tax=Brevibacillus agri TaxID=51101 RepID=UPI0024BFD234|nr:suppressor of fused domain protein [Brevibacillus agri]WHX30141.1 suppressor of fused domain protein [Brevibacillus agri]